MLEDYLNSVKERDSQGIPPLPLDAEQTSGESSQDFTPILNYRVANESGTTKTYQVDLTRFTGLPIIYLTTESPVVSKEDYVNGTFHLEGGREYDSVDEMAMEIRG